jgi:EmrB/QacA subfamily drug resistance transporter
MAQATTAAPGTPTVPLSHREIMVILSGVLLAMSLGTLDQTIVTTALPAIARDLQGFEHLSWVVVAYMLTSTGLILVYGKISDTYGRGRLMLLAVVIFVVASVLCALARNIGELVAARALQGAGAGGLAVMAQALIGDIAPPHERARYQSYISIMWAISGAAGPPLGGFLVDSFGWRSCFWINLPLGIAAFWLCRKTTARLRAPAVAQPIDYLGLALLTAATTALLLMVTWGGISYPWISPPILGSFAAAALLGTMFVLRELRAGEPLFPPRVFANAVVRLSDATGFLASMLYFASLVLTPVYFQLVLGASAGASGGLLMPLLVGTTITSYGSGIVMRRTGRFRGLMPASFVVMAIGFLLLAGVNASTSTLAAVAIMGVLGLGIGTCFPVLNVAVQNASEPRDIGLATSTVIFSRSLGGAFGAAIFWTLLLAFLSGMLGPHALEHARAFLFTVGRDTLGSLGDAERTAIVSALGRAFQIVFTIAAALSLVPAVLSLMIPDSPPSRKTAASSATAASG